MDKRLLLVLGGARSGKSIFAETWASQHGRDVLFVATAEAHDDEMRERIAHHRAQRPAHWRTLEASTSVGDAIRREAGSADVVVLDCITLLATSVLLALPDTCSQEQYNGLLLREVDDLLRAYSQSAATWLVVSNEVGMGVVPPYPYGRRFRDGLGQANRRLASAADEVILMVAGLPWVLKPTNGMAGPKR